MPFSFKTDAGADGLILAMTHSSLSFTAAALAFGRSRPARWAAHAPVLLANDPASRRAPFATSLALADALPSARLDATGGLSHRRFLSDPEVIALVVRHVRSGRRTEAP